MVEVLERCWEHDPDDRAEIFEVLKILRAAVAEADRRKEEQGRQEQKQ